MKNQKGFVILLVIIIAVLVIGGGVYIYSKKSNSVYPKDVKNEAVLTTYTALQSDAWKSKFIATNIPFEWSIPSKNVTIKQVQTNIFSCGSIPANLVVYTSHNSGPNYVGGWYSTSVMDCGNYYFIYESGDSGPKLYGPFEKDQDTTSSTSSGSGWKTAVNDKYKFSVQYPESKWIQDKPRENGVWLNPAKDTLHFNTSSVTIIFSANDAECNRFASFKKPDGETLTIEGIVFQHVSEKVKTPMNKLIDNYEVFDKYFYEKNKICYSTTLHTYTTLSKLDKSDPTGNARLTDLQLQNEWSTIEKEIESFKADYKEMIATFKFI